MNIMIATKAYWPSSGGVQMVTQYLAEGLAKKGHYVEIVTKLLDNCCIEEEHNDVVIKRFKEKDISKFHYGEKRQFQEYVVKETTKYDVLVVVCANSFAAQWIYPIIDKVRCKKVLYQHGMYDGRLHLKRINSFNGFVKQLLLTPFWELYHKYYWNAIGQFDACVHLFRNDSSHQYFINHGYFNNYIIMNACEEVFFEPCTNDDKSVREQYDITAPYYLYVANYCSRKNQKLAVRSFCAMNYRDMELVMVGSEDNQYVNELRDFISEMDNEFPQHGKIHILIDIPREDIVSLTKLCYACLITSNNEYLPIVIIEAMAGGHPFISTNSGVVSKIPGGITVNENENIAYWLDYYANNPVFVGMMGKIAKNFAEDNLHIEDKIRELEMICLS